MHTIPFVKGLSYYRQELHDQFGGKRQRGISTPRRYPFIFLLAIRGEDNMGIRMVGSRAWHLISKH